MRQSLAVSFFSFILSLVIASLYWAFRIGLMDNSILIVLKVLGLSAFILFVPAGFQYVRKKMSEASNLVFFNDAILPLYGLLLVAVAGYVSSLIQINIGLLFVIAGYALFFLALYQFRKNDGPGNKLILILLAAFFAFFVGPMCWFWHLKPFFLEMLVFGTDKLDALFHIAAAQMIKTYGVGTTGLDGVVAMNYHWGSHWIFAHISNLLNIPVLTVYQLCFPVIIAPLLFRSFLSFVIQVKQRYRPESEARRINFIFWIVFLAIFIGFFKGFLAGNQWAEYSTGGTSLTFFMLSSESYTFSIIIMMALLSVTLSFWIFKDSLTVVQQCLFMFLLFPGMMAFIGLVKVSTLYVVFCLFSYLFLRLKLSKSKLFSGGMLLAFLTTVVTLVAVYDSKDNHGSLASFYFYNHMGISLLLFGTVFYIWTHIFIVVYVVKEKIYKLSYDDLFTTKKLLPIECVLAVSVAGFLPTMFLRIQSYDSLYFTEIQMWISAALVLVYVPFYLKEGYSKKAVYVFAIPCAILFFVFLINTKVFWRNLWKESGKIRGYLLQEKGNLKSEVDNALKDFDFKRAADALAYNRQQFDSVYNSNRIFSFFQKLKQLDDLPLQEKRKTLVYVDVRKLFQRSDYNWKLHCHNIAFVVPAISGMAMIDGIDVTYPEVCQLCCEEYGYGYHYYRKWKTKEEIDGQANIEDLSKRVSNKGFENLIFYNFQTESFEKHPVRNFAKSQ